jgi:hypothetical protein
MGAMVRGDFDASETLKTLTIGEIMGYEKCTGDYNCFVHDNCNVSTKNKWYNDGVEVTENLALAIVDFTIDDMKQDGFINNVLDKIKAQVTLQDIFGNVEGTPLSLIPADTKIGEINGTLKAALQTKTAGEMYDAGVLNLGDPNEATSTYNQLNETFGKLAIAKKKGLITSLVGYELHVEAAIASVYGAGFPDSGYAVEDVRAVGLYFWRHLTPNELINVLIGSVTLPAI